MSALSIQPTYPIFTETDGQPLEDGYIWIGTANLDPQGNPINVYWDAALTQLAGQPIRTQGGYPVNSGTPARLYVNSDYSIHVMNKNGSVVYSAPAATERYGNIINAAGVIYDPPFAGAVQTDVAAKLSETISVKDFGAVGDGITDDTAAFNAAIDYLRTQTYAGGTLFIPDPEEFYKVTSVDCTGFSFNSVKFIAIKGQNNQTTIINGSQDDVAVWDCTGSSRMTISDIWIGTVPGTYAQCGLLLSRSTTETQANGNNFYNVWVQGDFKKAACISIGAESSRWFAPSFRNPYPLASPYKHCSFYTADQNGIGASSLYQTIYAGPAISPNTDNAMFKPHFFAEDGVGGVDNVVFEGAGQWTMYSALVLAAGASNNNMVTYVADATSNVFNGGITWVEPLFESASYTAHKLVGYPAVSVEARFQGIKQIGGYNNNWQFSSYTLIRGEPGIGLPYNLTDCDFVGMRHNIGNGAIVYADVITRGNYDCKTMRVLVADTGYTQDVHFGNFQADSRFGTQRLGVPIQTAGTVPPAVGYYPKNSVSWNENPTQGGPIGWVCIASGSPGTWKSFGLVNRNDIATGTSIVQSIQTPSIMSGDFVDLALNTGGAGYQGFLTVACTTNATGNQRTQSTYSLFGRGTDSSFQLIATDDGTLGPASFTVSTPSSDTIRITNTSGVLCAVTAQFFGGISG